MSEAFNILSDAKFDLCAVEAALTSADTSAAGASPEAATEFRHHAQDSVANLIKRLRDLEKVIEYELCVPNHS